MNDGPEKFHTGYLVEGLELLIRKVAYTKYDATGWYPGPTIQWLTACTLSTASFPYFEKIK
jgi:hypothetical protein